MSQKQANPQIIVGTVATVVAILGTFVVAKPFVDTAQESRAERVTVMEQKSTVDSQNEDLQRKAANLDEQESKVNQFISGFPNESQQNVAITNLISTAQQNGLKMTSISYGNPSENLTTSRYMSVAKITPKSSTPIDQVPLVSVPVSVSFEGDSEGFTALLDQLSSGSRAFMVDGVSIEQGENGQGNFKIEARTFVAKGINKPEKVS